MKLLKVSTRNTKLMALQAFTGQAVVSIDLPAGWSCPSADICLAKSNRTTGVITRGKRAKFLCYASKAEAMYKNTRNARWYNFDILRNLTVDGMAEVIMASLPKTTKIVRVHSSGDFFNVKYFQAWVKVAESMPDIIFFGYTKVLPYVIASKPNNFVLQYSNGGVYDTEAKAMNVPTCYVRTNKTDYIELPTVCTSKAKAHEDFYMILAKKSFVIDKH
jgi:hypothetical protein